MALAKPLQSLLLIRWRQVSILARNLVTWQRSPVLNRWNSLSMPARGAITGGTLGALYTGASWLENQLHGNSPVTTYVTYSAPFFTALAGRAIGKWRQRALTDPLMQVLRREAFESWIAEQQRALRRGKPRTLLFADLDNFKAWNDALGKPEGDALLQRIGREASAVIRFRDVAGVPGSHALGRWGGDELVFGGSFNEGQGAVVAKRLEGLVLKLQQEKLAALRNEMARAGGSRQRELSRLVGVLKQYPLGLSVAVRPLNPGDTLEGLKQELSRRLDVIKESRRPQRLRVV